MAVVFDKHLTDLRMAYKSLSVAETSFGFYDLQRNGLGLKQY